MPRGTSLLGVQDLQASEQAAITHEYNLILDINAHLFQGVKILDTAEVGVDDLAGGLAGDGVAVEGGPGVGAGGVLVAVVGRFVDGEIRFSRTKEWTASRGRWG